jgi:hypothetical protein
VRSLLLLVALGSFAHAAPDGAKEGSGHAILVMGTVVRPDGRPGAGLRRRLQTAWKLAKREPAATIVVSGGTRGGKWPAEGPAMARWLEAHGVDAARIRVEVEALDTAENANFTVPIFEKDHISRVTVVTERFHLPRALFHVEAAAAEHGDRFVIDGAAAPDALLPAQREKVDAEERAKIVRDKAFRAAHAPSRPATLSLAPAGTPLSTEQRKAAP